MESKYTNIVQFVIFKIIENTGREPVKEEIHEYIKMCISIAKAVKAEATGYEITITEPLLSALGTTEAESGYKVGDDTYIAFPDRINTLYEKSIQAGL